MRNDRNENQIRPINIKCGTAKFAEGSCQFSIGQTQIHCTASIETKVPHFLRGKGSGWITAEYSMLPRATHQRTEREATKGKQSSRTQEIQRLIGRSLRACIDEYILGERQITVDCDVLNADGGTRTASVNGAFIATSLAVKKLIDDKVIEYNPIVRRIGAISVGVTQNGTILLDMDFAEDNSCIFDANFVLDHKGNVIEIQCTNENTKEISKETFDKMYLYAKDSISLIIKEQNKYCC